MAVGRKQRSIYNLIYSIIGQAVTISLGFILPRLFILNYGSNVNGLLNSLSQIFVYMGLFEAGVGAVTLQALYRPVAENDYNQISGIMAATDKYYKRTGILYLIALILLSLIYPLLTESGLDYWTVCFVIMFYGMSNVVLFFFQGKYKILLQAEGKSYITTNLGTIITIAASISKIICIYMGKNIVTIIFFTFLINMIQAFYIMYYIKSKYNWLNLRTPPNTNAIAQKNAMLIHQIAGMVFQNTDVLILTFVCDLKVVSVYSMYKLVVMHIGNALNLGLNSINFALGQIYSTNIERFKKIITAFETYYSAVAFAIYTVALYMYIPFMKLYTDKITDINYIDNILPWLFIVIELLVVMRTPMLNTINYAGHFKLTLPQTIIETVINLVVSIASVLKWGIYGVLFGTIAAMVYRTNDIIIYANKKILKRGPWRSYLINAINFILLISLNNVFNTVIRWELTTYLRLLIVGGILTVISLSVFIGIQSLIFLPQTKKLLNIVKRYCDLDKYMIK